MAGTDGETSPGGLYEYGNLGDPINDYSYALWTIDENNGQSAPESAATFGNKAAAPGAHTLKIIFISTTFRYTITVRNDRTRYTGGAHERTVGQSIR
ncbi:MAG: hypothetical protein QF577_08345 [Phycisphaerae bacterium]|jgi:hypothetical protein|nr:hypothetical protein [Phycisphaerae bacterium]MDP7637541.1 hypothetical protein [Phycisphaerae bacterium]